MPGVGTGLTATLTQAGFSAAASQMTIGTLSNGGDLGAGLRGVLSRDGLRNIGMAMATAGLMEGIEQALPASLKGAQGLNTQKSIEQHLASGFTKSIAGGVAGTAFGRRFDIEDILGTGFVEGLGALGANMICDWYNKNPDYYWAHKASHFGLGALMGASLNSKDPVTAALAGGVGGVVGEMAAEMLFGGPTELAKNPINPDSIRTEAFVSKMVGGIAGTLASQGEHPHIAFLTAHNAVENNSARAIRFAAIAASRSGSLSKLVGVLRGVEALENILHNGSGENDSAGRKGDGSNKGSSSEEPGEPKDSKGKIDFPDRPDNSPHKNLRGTSAKELEKDGSIWDKDTSRHGGEQWKRWNNRKGADT